MSWLDLVNSIDSSSEDLLSLMYKNVRYGWRESESE